MQNHFISNDDKSALETINYISLSAEGSGT